VCQAAVRRVHFEVGGTQAVENADLPAAKQHRLLTDADAALAEQSEIDLVVVIAAARDIASRAAVVQRAGDHFGEYGPA
jgi:hypothetical protein